MSRYRLSSFVALYTVNANKSNHRGQWLLVKFLIMRLVAFTRCRRPTAGLRLFSSNSSSISYHQSKYWLSLRSSFYDFLTSPCFMRLNQPLLFRFCGWLSRIGRWLLCGTGCRLTGVGLRHWVLTFGRFSVLGIAIRGVSIIGNILHRQIGHRSIIKISRLVNKINYHLLEALLLKLVATHIIAYG